MDRTKPFVLCYPNQKRPIGSDWGHNPLSAKEVSERLATKSDLNVGILLGPQTGIIDVECDGEAATAHYAELFRDTRTPCWSSKRGFHYAYRYDSRLAGLPGTMKLKPSGLEFRLGNGKQIQSVIPPSVVEGVKREWIVSMDECEPAPLPELVVHLLLLEQPEQVAVETRECSAVMASPELIKRAQQYVAKCAGVGVGERNKKTFSIAGHCYKFIDEHTSARLSENQIVNLLRVWNCKNAEPLPDDELRQCVVSAMSSRSPRPDKVVEASVSVDDLLAEMRSTIPLPGTDESVTADCERAYKPREIKINHELHRMVDEGICALGHAPNTYQYSQALVEVVHDAKKPKQCLHDNGSPQLVPIPKPTLATRLSAWALWQKLLKDGWKSTTPPDTVVSAIHVVNNWPSVPVITGVVSCPVLRADGSILTTPGYDRETGLYLEQGESYPSLMPPEDAVLLLTDIVHDFPFETDAHRSAAIAFLITMLARSAFAGSSPFFLFDANSPRTGKGLITDVTTMIVEGRKACRYSWSKDNEETRKLITTVGMSGALYLMWDNIKGTLGGPALEQMMTTGFWADRLLSLNRQVTFPIRFISAGTSNNAKLSRDMTGRTCHSYLKTDLENPEERSGFRYPDILSYVKQRRPELVMAALSIPAAYIAAGRPDQHLTPWGGFEEWSNLVRGSMVWAGMPDPGETRATLRERTDDESGLLLAILQAWPKQPVTVAQAIKMSKELPELGEIIAELPERDRTKELGYLLREARGRVIGGKRLQGSDTKPVKWEVLDA